MMTRVLAAGQEDEEIRNSGILILNEQDVKKAFIKEGYKEIHYIDAQKQQTNNKSHRKTYDQSHDEKFDGNIYDTQPSKSEVHHQNNKPS